MKNLYLPISKVDEEKRMVYGYASTESMDSQGEIVKLSALQEALPDYMKFANVREMHSNKAAGKVKESNINKDGWFIGVKVVADDAWKLVKEQVYNGFSIGGKVLEKIEDEITKLRLSEISLVDRPANPDAVFTMVKFDGSKMEKDINGALETLEVAQQAEAIAVGEMINGEDTTHIDNAVEELKAHAQTELAEPEAHENLPKALQDAGADEEAQEVIEPDEDNEAETMGYADKTGDLAKGNIPAGMIACDKCAGKPGAMGSIGGAVCKKCMGKGYVAAPKDDEKDGEVNQPGEPMHDKVDKAEQSTATRNSLDDSDFAYIDSKGERKLPINDEAHVRNALARFNQTQFDSDADKAKAKAKIDAAAKKFGIESNKYDMPTEDMIVESLKKADLPVNEKTIGMAKDAAAGRILDTILKEQEGQMNSDAAKLEFLGKLSKSIAEIKPVMPKGYQPNTYGVLKKDEVEELKDELAPETPKVETTEVPVVEPTEPTEPAVETPAEPADTAETEDAEKLEKSDSIAKLDGLMAKLDALDAKVASLEKLEERIVDVEKAAMPVKVTTALVERFDVSNETNLLRKVDEVSARLKVDPNNLQLQEEALNLQKEVMASRR